MSKFHNLEFCRVAGVCTMGTILERFYKEIYFTHSSFPITDVSVVVLHWWKSLVKTTLAQNSQLLQTQVSLWSTAPHGTSLPASASQWAGSWGCPRQGSLFLVISRSPKKQIPFLGLFFINLGSILGLALVNNEGLWKMYMDLKQKNWKKRDFSQ